LDEAEYVWAASIGSIADKQIADRQNSYTLLAQENFQEEEEEEEEEDTDISFV
jgi:hypothetical protein